MLFPRGSGAYPGVTPQGIAAEGAKPDRPLIATIAIPDFIVTIEQADGTERTFARNSPKVVVADPLQAHIDLLLAISDKTMHDLTAYLVTLK